MADPLLHLYRREISSGWHVFYCVSGRARSTNACAKILTQISSPGPALHAPPDLRVTYREHSSRGERTKKRYPSCKTTDDNRSEIKRIIVMIHVHGASMPERRAVWLTREMVVLAEAERGVVEP